MKKRKIHVTFPHVTWVLHVTCDVYNVTLTSHRVEAVAIQRSRLLQYVGFGDPAYVIFNQNLSLLTADGNRQLYENFMANFIAAFRGASIKTSQNPVID